MKAAFTLSALLAATVAAAPLEVSTDVAPLEKRQSTTSNDLINGACLPLILIYARGSGESGNMGDIMGPGLCSALKAAYPNKVACQGVGGAYDADFQANLQPGGTTAAAIAEGLSMINLAWSKCPSSKVVFGGYSQGSAVMEGAVKSLTSAQMTKLAGGVFFGYTQNAQTGGKIPGFPSNKLDIFCNFLDVLCQGIELISPTHLLYQGSIAPAVSFLTGLVGSL